MRHLLILTMLLGVSMPGFTQNTWFQVDSMNGPGKSVATAFVLNNEGYVVGGLTEEDFTRKMYSYDSDQNDWDDELSWGGETGNGQNRGSACSFVINNIAYVGLGQGNSALFYKDWWTYNPITETWTQQADFIGTPRHGAVAFNLHNIGFVGLGQDPNGLCNDFYKFNPITNIWAQLTDFNGTSRKFAIGTVMGDQAYVGFGDDGVYKNDLWQYDEFSDEWIQKASLPAIGRSGATSWAIFPSLFIACGEDNQGNASNEVWEYNYFGNTWLQRAALPGPPRKHPVSFVIHNIAYVGSGYSNGVYLDDFYGYFGTLETSGIIEQPIELFPNPCTEQLHLKALDLEKFSSYEILDLQGKTLQTGAINNCIDVRFLSNGTYICAIRSKNNQISHQCFVKK